MSDVATRRIAEKFAQLSAGQRRAVYQRLRADGMSIGQFPILKRDGSAAQACALSYAQARQWFLWQLDPSSTAYHIAGGLALKGELNVDAVHGAFSTLVARHEALRTVFKPGSDGLAEQVILPKLDLNIELTDLSALAEDVREARVRQEAMRISQQTFDLTQGPLLRVGLIKSAIDRHVLVVVMHHIVSDGWSMQIIVDEFAALYRAAVQDGAAELSELPIQYADYAVWQRSWMEAGEQERQLAYWTGQLGKEPAVLQLPADRPRRADGIYSAARHSATLPSELASSLRKLAQTQGATLFMVLLSGFQSLLNRYTGQTDVRIGVPIANRHRVESERVIGFFVNTQVLRNRLHGRISLAQALAQTRDAALGAQEHQDLPYEQLVEALQPERSLSGNPLFQVMFNHQRTDYRALQHLPGLELNDYALDRQQAQFELTLDTREDENGVLSATFSYAADLFDEATVARIAQHYQAILQAMSGNPEQLLGDVELLDEEQHAQLQQWSDNHEHHDGEEPVHRLFEKQAENQPASCALLFGDASLSYGELNARANRLAHHLIELGVRPENKVGVALERSFEMVVSLLAILKAGGAYVPLDPEYPAERLRYMVEDSGIGLLLTHSQLLPQFRHDGVTALAVDQLNLDEQPAHNPATALHGENLAYVIYTSGSTGRPKGAANRHRSLYNRLAWMQQAYGLTPADTVLQKTPFSFDVSVWEFFWPLMMGARLVIAAPGEHREPARLRELICRHQVTTLHFVPSMLQAFLAHEGVTDCRSLTRIVCSGEALPAEAQHGVFKLLPQAALYNLYGPTEAAIDVTHWTCRADGGSQVPIGQPISQTKTYVLDGELNLVPAGVAGELYLGGIGLARGYLERPALTSERFVADPFDPLGGWLYRTGDLVRWNGEGQLEYLGRLDHQVKIRGLRIELGEIEAQLLAQPELREAVVVAREGAAGTRLVAYVSTQAGESCEASQIRERLAKLLPDYMVPSAIVVLETLPLNANGKVDRKALPEPDFSSAAYEAPQGRIEENLAALWSELLGVEKIGRQDNFFELGGHSLLALKLLERMRGQGLPAQVRNLFQYPQLAAFAKVLEQDASAYGCVAVPPNGIPKGCIALTPEMVTLATLNAEHIAIIESAVPGGAANIQDIYPLAPLQEGILFHHVLQSEGDAYVTPQMLSFDSEQRLSRFVESLNQVIARHDILRTAVLWEGLKEPLQIVWREARLQTQWLDAGTDDAAAVLTAAVNPARYRIDVRQAPMIRALAARDQASGRYLLQLPSHHLVVDHTTLELLVEEIGLIQQDRVLPPAVPFRDFVAQARFGVSQEEQEAFFRQMLGDVEEPTAPFNLIDVQGNGSAVEQARLELAPSLSARLRQAAQGHGVSAATLFHLAWAVVLAKASGKDDVVFGTVLFGRMQGGEDVSRALGLFINTLPLRIRLGTQDVVQCLRQTQAALTGLLQHEHASLSLAQRCSGLPGGTPLFSALLNYRYGSKPSNDAGMWQGVELLGGEERSNYPLSMSVDDMDGDLALVAQVPPAIGALRLCEMMQETSAALVDALALQPATLACELPVMSGMEMALLRQWSVNRRRHADAAPLHRLFERQAALQPHAQALLFGEQVLSYAELNAKANRLAHRLLALGVRPEDKIGVCIERSIDMVAALLAILKTGAAYVPLDPEYPPDRLQYMAEDSAIGLLLSHTALQGIAPGLSPERVLLLDQIDLSAESVVNPDIPVHGENLAYVIYTSGSTGMPKGAANRHYAVASCMLWMQDTYHLNADDTVLHKAPFGFDVSVWELFWPLTSGARLALALPGDQRDPARLVALIQQHQITTVNFVPAMLQAFLAHEGIEASTRLKHIICGGEAMPAETQKETFQRLRQARLHNLYGPTETAIHVTNWACRDDGQSQVPIGRPISDTSAYVLDAGLSLTPAGVAGELYLGGVSLGRGYLGRPGLSAERFVADPFDPRGGRLYRTGDLVRWNEEGQLEYLGRIDHQVKIRGFRVELGEVEAQLLAQPEVREVVVVAKQGPGGTLLVAYLSAHEGQGVDVALLRERLRRTLPEHMVPGAIMVMPSLPLNANGKVDRKALPEPELAARSYEAPQGELEETLAAIWSDVLGQVRVGRQDNFFELGGDSILSLQIVARARRAGWDLNPKLMFERPTIADLGCALRPLEAVAQAAPQQARGRLSDYLSGPALSALPVDQADIEDVYPLSPLQEGMLFLSLEAAGSGLYMNQLSVAVTGLNAARLAQAWHVMVRRHAVLRTGFVWQAGADMALQMVWREADAFVETLDWRGHGDIAASLSELRSAELLRITDFSRPALARLFLLRVGENEHRLLLSMHHILLDGWSQSRLLGELLQTYGGRTLEPVQAHYGDYIRWLKRQPGEAAEEYWRGQLQHLDGPSLLASRRREETGYGKIYLRWDAAQTRVLSDNARTQHVTVNTVVQAAWATLLQRHLGKDTVCFGATVAGRPADLAGAEEMVGLFINTIPVLAARQPQLPVGEFLRRLQAANLDARQYEHTPLAQIQRWGGSGGQALFDSIIVFENYPMHKALSEPLAHGLSFGDVGSEGLTGYAMDLQVTLEGALEIEFCYARASFGEDEVLALRAEMDELLQAMSGAPELPMGELKRLKAPAAEAVLALGRTGFSQRPAWVHQQIEQHARLRPDAVALRMGDQTVSFAELNARANRLAHWLLGQGVKPEDRVAVLLPRSTDMIVTLLAILKAGAGYVPLDAEYPLERLRYIIGDCAPALLIGSGAYQHNLPCPTVWLEQLQLEGGNAANPGVALGEHQLAYVIYTSGSTGQPKGVAVAHGPLAMHCAATNEIYATQPDSCELLFMSFSFDGAHERWISALTAGASVAIRDPEVWTAEQASDALHRYGVSTVAFPPAYLSQLADWAGIAGNPPPVELYVFGGEAMPKAGFEQVRRHLRPQRLINGYGPTETVVTPLIWQARGGDSFACAYAPIGRPVGERTAYVLDADMQLVPHGAVGELYIGGYGLARGYIGRSDLTAERFVADPFSVNGGRLYRTGDLVRWLDDGNAEYIGRADHQVKIRGFRIELGEIEAQLRKVAGVSDVAVLAAAGDGGASLQAYLASDAPAQEVMQMARMAVADTLPDFMQPSAYAVLPKLPRLPTGKLDRHSLPPIQAESARQYRAPSTPEAQLMAGLWQEVLGIETVGETDNFFELGGDSLLCLKLISRMRALKDARFNFKLRDLTQKPTIAKLLGLEAEEQAAQSGVTLLNREGSEPLFCLHAGFGTIFDYQPLARKLDGVATVYGIACRMLADSTHVDASLEQMARDYASMIRQTQAAGPYRLLGWSLGGTLAAMVAALLEADGQSVSFAGLVDPFIPGTEQAAMPPWQQDFSDFLSQVLPGVTLDALPPAPGPELEALLAQALAGNPSVYGAMGAAELLRGFEVARHLKALSIEAGPLRKLACLPHYWWAEGRDADQKAELLRQTGAPGTSSDIAAGHYTITRSEQWLEQAVRLGEGVLQG
ncbi:non-ribosomal peptide synthetase [Pseudoduganella violacea]|uniref:Amino acid adenylation domain-containing protein n=1 Tax=Pseudoduganella violacea TaxID=1715466 RepID=A0A7W5BDH1_9BURK|nr:non-ribosomal peptide synthetase [Pseudoduganella violacea]MBB3120918.1 amino acid adenylation domain-containing protein [Pseudoduganella violacea]